jgi:hypothetical protein
VLEAFGAAVREAGAKVGDDFASPGQQRAAEGLELGKEGDHETDLGIEVRIFDTDRKSRR